MAQQDLDLDVETEEEGAGKGGGLKIVIIAIVAVLLLSSAVLAGLYFMGMLGGTEKTASAASGAMTDGASETQSAAARSGSPLIYQPLEPPFVVNFNSDSDVRFMQITIQVADRDPSVIEMVKEHNPAIRNGLVMLFSSQQPDVLNTREGKEQLREDALNEVRHVLKQMTGKGKLENLYFTSFVMQ